MAAKRRGGGGYAHVASLNGRRFTDNGSASLFRYRESIPNSTMPPAWFRGPPGRSYVGGRWEESRFAIASIAAFADPLTSRFLDLRPASSAGSAFTVPMRLSVA